MDVWNIIYETMNDIEEDEETNWAEDLAKLISENPGLEVIPISDTMTISPMCEDRLYPGFLDRSKVLEVAWVETGSRKLFLIKGEPYMEKVFKQEYSKFEIEVMRKEPAEAMRCAIKKFGAIEWKKAIVTIIDARCVEEMW